MDSAILVQMILDITHIRLGEISSLTGGVMCFSFSLFKLLIATGFDTQVFSELSILELGGRLGDGCNFLLIVFILV